MYPPGHVGIALALYAPAGLVLLVRGRARLAVVGTFVIAGATLLPDVDKWLPWLVHRGSTHTVWFALGVGVALGVIAVTVGTYHYRDNTTTVVLGAFGVYVGTVAVLAHLLGDVITPMGVRPFYPLSDASYTFDLVFASDPTANARLFALGCLATIAQVLLGAGLAPTESRRPAFRGTLNVVERSRHVLFGAPDAPPGAVTQSESTRPSPPRVRESDD